MKNGNNLIDSYIEQQNRNAKQMHNLLWENKSLEQKLLKYKEALEYYAKGGEDNDEKIIKDLFYAHGLAARLALEEDDE